MQAHGGFYTRAPSGVFGASGAFVTSPEISQMFGELVGLWCAATWQQMGSPARVRLVELGPGRGTLMADLLRGVRGINGFADACEVELVEVSASMRAEQASTLGVELQGSEGGGEEVVVPGASGVSASGNKVTWRSALGKVPDGDGVPSLILAHELFDALPVHQFRRTDKGWCEVMVEWGGETDETEDLKFVLSPGPTTAAAAVAERRLAAMDKVQAEQLDALEASPASWALAAEVARRVGGDKSAAGAALLIDYGKFGPYEASLQAIKEHKFVDLLETPGEADLSAYVDFQALAQAAAEAVPGAVAYEPVDQRTLLMSLGIDVRTEMLAQAAGEASEQAAALRSQRDRLCATGGDGMGERFMAMAIASKDLPPPPVFARPYEPFSVPQAVAPDGAATWGKLQQR